MKSKFNSQSAFFTLRLVLCFVLSSVAVVLALLGLGVFSGPLALAQGAKQGQGNNDVQVGQSYRHDVSPPMRDVPPLIAADVRQGGDHEANENPKVPYRHQDSSDPVIQRSNPSMLSLLAPSLPAPLLNFDGIPFPGVGCNCAPPDTNGAVGKTQYVQIVNEGYQVFDKNTGACNGTAIGSRNNFTRYFFVLRSLRPRLRAFSSPQLYSLDPALRPQHVP